MAKIDYVVKIGGNVLGGQRGATLNRSCDSIDMTTKDSNGWKQSVASLKEWSIDSDGLIIASDTAFDALETAWENGTEVAVEFIYEVNNGKKYSGQALIVDFPVESPYDDTSTYSVSLMGTGALTKETVTIP